MPQASSLEAALKTEFGVSPTLTAGGGGIFDVVVDGEMIYSKHETGEFPQDDEIVRILRERG
ncbi:MAG: Rdx family protein [Deltaproteobacteria bacterium]|nr:Rdx family protein [Deltaproteobacteria bacterium]MBW2413768.1 Rdx family protein [Deltaproteobacteria bacterium]